MDKKHCAKWKFTETSSLKMDFLNEILYSEH